jgi:hypothetical protein
MEEVVGSIPTRSTIFNHLRQQLVSVVPVVVPLVESLHGELIDALAATGMQGCSCSRRSSPRAYRTSRGFLSGVNS